MLLLYFMLMRKNVIYTTEKQNMTSDFFLFAVIALQFIMQRLHYNFGNK